MECAGSPTRQSACKRPLSSSRPASRHYRCSPRVGRCVDVGPRRGAIPDPQDARRLDPDQKQAIMAACGCRLGVSAALILAVVGCRLTARLTARLGPDPQAAWTPTRHMRDCCGLPPHCRAGFAPYRRLLLSPAPVKIGKDDTRRHPPAVVAQSS